MMTNYLPNMLSISRMILAGLMFWSVYTASWYFAVGILWTAIGTDLADGYLARRLQITSPLGGLLDHGSDAIFVTATITALTFHNWAPVLLAAVIPAAFLQYMLDSKSLAGQPLRSSFLGRYNGIAYYVFAGFPVMQLTLGITLIPFDWFFWIGWGLITTTVISMLDRTVTLLSNRLIDK
ncbi:MAG: CDP-alcohol phosphatidyltransferase family protein [Gammaproteobacteria bacterium]|nr:CDP-alcohol phosphatidyltransferase family protein [Gammaproteobacteria bacterium]MBT7370147.1 CDP-alcohol phosphatidyltransferase family protein [Gammaproteobacteria bacterium]